MTRNDCFLGVTELCPAGSVCEQDCDWEKCAFPCPDCGRSVSGFSVTLANSDRRFIVIPGADSHAEIHDCEIDSIYEFVNGEADIPAELIGTAG